MLFHFCPERLMDYFPFSPFTEMLNGQVLSASKTCLKHRVLTSPHLANSHK